MLGGAAEWRLVRGKEIFIGFVVLGIALNSRRIWLSRVLGGAVR